MKIIKNFRLSVLHLLLIPTVRSIVNNGCAYVYPPCRLGLCGQYIQEFYNINPTQCDKCAPQCRTCLGAPDQCFSCSDLNHILHNSECFCKPGYLKLIGSCIQCETPCYACKINPQSCTECLDMNAIVINNQCKCKDGMYFDNDYTCQICDNNCKTCQQQYQCLTCFQYFFLDTNTEKCINCQAPCLDCFDASNCKTCLDGYHLLQQQCVTCQNGCVICDAQQCLLCNDGYFLNNNQCELCQDPCSSCQNSKTNCVTCIGELKVVKEGKCNCQIGYYEVQGQCVKCSYPCEICLDQCTKCFSIQNLFLNDGKCICQDGYFFNGTFCQGNNLQLLSVCDQSCLTCDKSPQTCLSCDSQAFRQLDNLRNRCICLNGYFEDENKVCQLCNNSSFSLVCPYKNCGDLVWTFGEQCDDGNMLSRDGCTNCQIDHGYFCQNTFNRPSICNICWPNCILCKSMNECSQCQRGYFMAEGYCAKCQEDCEECNSFNDCQKCKYLKLGNQCSCNQIEGYYLINDQCISICGDGLKAYSEQCDDGNQINNDGCDRNCQLENGYSFKNNYTQKLSYPTPRIQQIDNSNIYDQIRQFELNYDQPLKHEQFNWIIDLSISIKNFTQGADYQLTIIDQSQYEQSKINIILRIILVFNNKSLGEEYLLISFFDTTKFINLEGVQQQLTQIQCRIYKYQYIDDQTIQQTQLTIMYNQYLLYLLLILVLMSIIIFGGLEVYNNLLDLIQLVSYLQYINTQLPYNYETYLQLFQFAQFSFFNQYFPIEDYYITHIDQDRLQQINQKFSQDGYYQNIILNIHSIINVWALLFLFYFISLTIPSVLTNVKIILKIHDSQSMIKFKVCLLELKKILFKSTYSINQQFFYCAIIRTFMAIFYDLTFIILINLSTLNFMDDYYFNIIGSYTSLMFCSLYFLIFIFFFRTLRNKKHILVRMQNLYGPLFEGLKLRNSKYFYVYILIKKLYFMTSLVLLFNNPIYQVINITFGSLLQIVFIIAQKPYIDKCEQMKQLICEIQMFSLEILTCYLVYCDQTNQLAYEQRQYIGWVCILLTSLMLITQIIFDIIIQWKQYIRVIKQFKRKLFHIFNVNTKQQEINILDPLRQLF